MDKTDIKINTSSIVDPERVRRYVQYKCNDLSWNEKKGRIIYSSIIA